MDEIFRGPVHPSVLEVLLGIDFDVPSRRVDMDQPLAGFDHVLKQVDQVGLFEHFRFAKRTTGVTAPSEMVVEPQRLSAGV